jgi:hypothetical protein
MLETVVFICKALQFKAGRIYRLWWRRHIVIASCGCRVAETTNLCVGGCNTIIDTYASTADFIDEVRVFPRDVAGVWDVWGHDDGTPLTQRTEFCSSARAPRSTFIIE